MSEETNGSPHQRCTAHSGLSGRVNLVIALMLVAVGLLVTLLNQTGNLKSDLSSSLAVTQQQVQTLGDRVANLEDEMRDMQGYRHEGR